MFKYAILGKERGKESRIKEGRERKRKERKEINKGKEKGEVEGGK